MEESERIKRIMEIEGATEPEARCLHHLDKASRAWSEVADAREVEAKAPFAMRFHVHYKALQNMIFSEIHVRERPGTWDKE